MVVNETRRAYSACRIQDKWPNLFLKEKHIAQCTNNNVWYSDDESFPPHTVF